MAVDGSSRRLADHMYAVWRDQMFEYSSNGPASGRIIVRDGDRVPEGFTQRWPGHHVRPVIDDELAQWFSLRTYCAVDDEIYRLTGVRPDGRFELAWTKHHPDRAAELGLVQFERGMPFGGISSPEKVSEIWQRRLDHRPASATTDDEVRLLRRLDDVLRADLPADADHVELRFRAAGPHSELSWTVHDQHGTRLFWWPDPILSTVLVGLRHAAYEEVKGTWLSVFVALHVPTISLHTPNYTEEPAWREPPPRTDYQADLERFPRHAAHMPSWLRKHGPAQPNPLLRQAPVFDAYEDGSAPIVDRPSLPENETDRVLNYLNDAPAFLVERGWQTDLLDGAEDVPVAFHTDGAWIWPAEVAHYLRKHGIAPHQELLTRIRGRQYQLPTVDDVTVAEAEATITSHPVRLPPLTQRLAAEEHAVLANLKTRLADHGIPSYAYRIGTHTDGPVCLERVETGWRVATYDNGWPHEPITFQHITSAAAHLLGILLIHHQQHPKPSPETM